MLKTSIVIRHLLTNEYIKSCTDETFYTDEDVENATKFNNKQEAFNYIFENKDKFEGQKLELVEICYFTYRY